VELLALLLAAAARRPELVSAALRELVDRIEVHFVEKKRGRKTVQVFDYRIISLRPDTTSSHLACSNR
jgi:hypothetical protein